MKKFLNKLFKTLEHITRDEPRPSTCCCNHACKCKEAVKESSMQQDNPENTESVKGTSETTKMFEDFSGDCWKLEDLDYLKNYFSDAPYSYFTKILGLNDPSFSKIPCFFYGVDRASSPLGFHLFGIIIKLKNKSKYYAYLVGGSTTQYPCRESAYSIRDDFKKYQVGVFPNGRTNILFNQDGNHFSTLKGAKNWLEQFIGLSRGEWYGEDFPFAVKLDLAYNE